MDVDNGETKVIVDDIGLPIPGRPEALVARIMDDYFAFVRDGNTILTYEKGVLRQIFPKI